MGMLTETQQILIIVFSVVATILACVFIVPQKRRSQLGAGGRILHDLLNFKYLLIEKILQALYILSTAAVIITGFFMLFKFDVVYKLAYRSGRSYGYGPTQGDWIGYYGLIVMILGPIVIRIAYELLMMLVLLVKNVVEINNKLKPKEENTEQTSVQK